MHKYFKHTFILFLVGFFASSCSKDNKAPSTKAIVQDGKWRITNYNDNGANQTSLYAGYEFTFLPNGTVTAVKGATSVNGTWTTGADENTNHFVLNFTAPALLELNKDWTFQTKSYSIVKLENISATTGTDTFVLEKI
jgi:hypothetical protein